MVVNNLTGLTNATSIINVWTFADNISGNIMTGSFFIIIFLALTFGLSYKYGFEKALAASSFAAFILSGYMTFARQLNIIFPLAFLAILAFVGFYMYVRGEQR